MDGVRVKAKEDGKDKGISRFSMGKRFDVAERIAYGTPWLTEREKVWMVRVLMESMEKMLGKP